MLKAHSMICNNHWYYLWWLEKGPFTTFSCVLCHQTGSDFSVARLIVAFLYYFFVLRPSIHSLLVWDCVWIGGFKDRDALITEIVKGYPDPVGRGVFSHKQYLGEFVVRWGMISDSGWDLHECLHANCAQEEWKSRVPFSGYIPTPCWGTELLAEGNKPLCTQRRSQDFGSGGGHFRGSVS